MPDSLQKNAKTVVIVEDSADLRTLYSRALKAENYRVEVFASGEQALTALEIDLKPHVILFDLNLPGMSGNEFFARVRAHSCCTNSKMILVSGMDNLAARAREIGADGFMRKPVDLDALYSEIAKHMSGS